MTALDASYGLCRDLAKARGTTYFWSARLLPAALRRHVHALYAFARLADDIVDDVTALDGAHVPVEDRAAALRALGDRLFTDLDRGASDHPVLRAVVHTVRTFAIDPDTFRRFLRSMAMDLTVSSYDTWDDLLVYVDGSAAVIGEMMLPILDPADPETARPHARDLGIAFQLTNFLRDIGEDLDRGRQYVPRADTQRFDVSLDGRIVTPEFVALMQFEIGRCRALYASADVGIEMLPDRSARCVAAARTLYAAILDRIEAQRYDVFSARARVSDGRKAATVAWMMRPRPIRATT